MVSACRAASSGREVTCRPPIATCTPRARYPSASAYARLADVMYGWMTARSGRSSSSRSRSTCSSQMRTSSSGRRYPASVASPSGGKSEYLIGRKSGLVASVRAGRIIVTRMLRTLATRCGEDVVRRGGNCADAVNSPPCWSGPSASPREGFSDYSQRMDAALVDQVRRFNRTVTQRVGALDDSYLARARPLGQARVLWEIGPDGRRVRELRRRLDLDSGYLSRLLRALEADGLVVVEADPADARLRTVRLTPAGRVEYAELDRRSDELATAILHPLSAPQRDRLTSAMAEVERLLTASMVRVTETDRSEEHTSELQS